MHTHILDLGDRILVGMNICARLRAPNLDHPKFCCALQDLTVLPFPGPIESCRSGNFTKCRFLL